MRQVERAELERLTSADAEKIMQMLEVLEIKAECNTAANPIVVKIKTESLSKAQSESRAAKQENPPILQCSAGQQQGTILDTEIYCAT